MTTKLIASFVIVFFLFGCNTVPTIDFICIESYPHDTTSFTQGFLFDNGKLYESTGYVAGLPQTKSEFGIVDLSTGKIDVKIELDKKIYFCEGITILNGKIFQLTYKNKTGFIYNSTTFEKIGEFTFPSREGWGITTDGTSLIMSDGTNLLTFLNPYNFRVTKTIPVTGIGFLKNRLNELEYINGYIYANIWTTNTIVKINPENGKVVGKLNLSNLARKAKKIYPGAMEMNGIAYNVSNDNIFITGKLWPKIYEIKLNESIK